MAGASGAPDTEALLDAASRPFAPGARLGLQSGPLLQQVAVARLRWGGGATDWPLQCGRGCLMLDWTPPNHSPVLTNTHHFHLQIRL